MNGVWIHCTFSLIVKYYPWFWFLLALNSRCYHLQKMAQINVSWDGIPKTLLEEQCAAVLNSRISHQLTWLLGLNVFLSITAVLGNTLILVALGQEISLHAPSKLLLRCLSTTDLLVGLLSQPMYAAYEMSLLNGSLETYRLTFVISFIAGYILSGVSLFKSTAISLDRLLALLMGLRYKLVVTLKRARFTVTIIWIVGVVCSILYLWNDQIPLTYAYVCTLICLVISVFSYTTIFVTLRHRQTQVQDLINQHANPRSPMNIAFNRRAVSSALWLQITLVCCYLPHGIMSALLRHSEESTAASFNRHYTGTLVFANSTLNPFICCLTIREVRKVVREKISNLLNIQPQRVHNPSATDP